MVFLASNDIGPIDRERKRGKTDGELKLTQETTNEMARSYYYYYLKGLEYEYQR